MSRRGRQRRKQRGLDPIEVLEGRAAVDARELVELISRVNPTDRACSATERARRYALKNRLQSLLVRRFSAELEAVADERREGLAILGHRPSGRDAGHVVVAELEEDARLWVQRRLDEQLGPAGAEEAAAVRAPRPAADDAPPDVELSPLELVQQGQAALESYDFELAEQHLRRAVERSGGSPEAALSLLELLVDHLAAYDEALEAGEALPPAARDDARVRLLLGLAAARAGDVARAERLVQGVELPRAVEVHVTLADRALTAERDEEAARQLAAAERCGVASQELLRLSDALAALRAKKRGPAEQQLEQDLARGQLDRAEARARELLARWPDSEVARRVLGKIEGQRQREQLEQVVARAEQALDSGAFATAAGLFRQALAAGGRRGEIEARLAEAERREREEIERARVDRTAELLAVGGAEGLLAYLALEAPLRARVREVAPSPLLGWLEELGLFGSGGRARRAVEAVLALEQARQALARSDPQEAHQLLGPHARTLAGVADARAALEQSEALAREALLERARRAVGEARQALAAADPERARSLLDQVSPGALPPGERAALEEVAAAIDEAEDAARLASRVDGRLAEGDLLGARRALDSLLARGAGEERAALEQQRDALTGRIQREWRVELLEGEDLPELTLDPDSAWRWEHAIVCLDGDGGRAVLAAARGRWVFIQQVRLATGRVERYGVLRTPEPLGNPDVLVDRDSLWLFGDGGNVLELGLETLDIRRWGALATLLHRDAVVEDVHALPGSRFCWVESRVGELKDRGRVTTAVVDLERWRAQRELPDFNPVVPIHGAAEPLLLCHRDETGCNAYEPRGALHPSVKVPAELDLSAAAVHPDGRGLVVLHAPSDSEARHAGPLMVTALAADGSAAGPLCLEGADAERMHCAATAKEAGLTFVLFVVAEEGPQLVALRPGAGGIEQVFRCGMPRGTCLAQDAAARRVVALVPRDAGIGLAPVPLGATPPTLPAEPARRALEEKLPAFGTSFFCGHGDEDNARVLAFIGALQDLSRPAVTGWVQRAREANRDEPEQLLALHRALERTAHFAEAAEVVRWAGETHPDHPGVAVAHADALARDGDWPAVRRRLEPISAAGLDDAQAMHRHHLLGIALLLAGEAEAALKVLEQGTFFVGGDCELEPYIALARPFPEGLPPASWGPDQPRVRQLAGATLAADAALARGAPAAALEALERPQIWRTHEVQSLARLAEAHLRLEPPDPAGRLAKRFALATFCHRQQHCIRREIPVPGATWDSGRLDDLVERCEAWLEQEQP